MMKWSIVIGAWLSVPATYALWGSCEVGFGFAVGISYMAFIGEVK
jgi:hypothetical protein